jgi:hypothetical protein
MNPGITIDFLKGLRRCSNWSGKHDWYLYYGNIERCAYCGAKRQA